MRTRTFWFKWHWGSPLCRHRKSPRRYDHAKALDTVFDATIIQDPRANTPSLFPHLKVLTMLLAKNLYLISK